MRRMEEWMACVPWSVDNPETAADGPLDRESGMLGLSRVGVPRRCKVLGKRNIEIMGSGDGLEIEIPIIRVR